MNLAIDQLQQALVDLERARATLRLIREREVFDIERMRVWRDALLQLSTPLYLGAYGAYSAARVLAEQLGERTPDFVEWLTGVVTKPAEPPSESAQAHALFDWLSKFFKQLPSATKTALTYALQSVYRGYGGVLAGLDRDGFLAELARPGGGRVGLVDGIGPTGLAALREALGVEGGVGA